MKSVSVLLTALVFMFIGCSDDDTPTQTSTDSDLTLSINGLEDLGSSAMYEGWLIVPSTAKTGGIAAETAVSTGTFSVNANGELSKTSFSVDNDDLANAAVFVLTIEPYPDSDPNPSAIHILAGDFSSSSASLSVSHAAALGNDFSDASGEYILATPTDGSNNNENSGIWFLELSSGSPMQGLFLPTLPAGWKYEGWTVINGVPVTTGTFTSTTVFDDADPYSSTMGGPPFAGEDFLMNAPAGLTFPTNIAGGVAVISIEPSPDNSASPFLLKPLVGMIPSDAADHVTYMMDKNLGSFPSGTAGR